MAYYTAASAGACGPRRSESGPSEFDQWLENYDKKYEDPTLEAAEQRKADNTSFLSL